MVSASVSQVDAIFTQSDCFVHDSFVQASLQGAQEEQLLATYLCQHCLHICAGTAHTLKQFKQNANASHSLSECLLMLCVSDDKVTKTASTCKPLALGRGANDVWDRVFDCS